MVEAESMSKVNKIDDDRLSNLPDPLLCHILSSLPTKQAVATSILSRRWNPLWRFITSLDFDDGMSRDGSFDKESLSEENERKYLRFVRFVNKVLFSRDKHRQIKSFRLKCYSIFICSHNINAWVDYAIRHKVEHLDIKIPFPFLKSGIYVPSSVLTCETIVVLKLECMSFSDYAYSICLPSLKTLHLEAVFFEETYSIELLFSGCTLLENLVLKCYAFYNLGWQHLEIKPLPCLVSADVATKGFPLAPLYNAKSLRLVTYDFIEEKIPVFQNLAHMELIFRMYYDWNLMMKILQNTPILRCLVIIKGLTSINEDKVEQCFAEDEVGCVSSSLRKCLVVGFEGLECEVQFVRFILQNAQVLRTIRISCSDDAFSNSDTKLDTFKNLSTCPRISTSCELFFE
ncbi:F-box/FBD/LRR-repeat protein [Senna tora]|uniref:F-box/FBD/LRR-repeat protein n=1 Tax=Senna tora TaxID=362788 RepID=A0A834WQL8_9FABA|nr:F-box/FBD/LRR-repeat protein [Senna tora]